LLSLAAAVGAAWSCSDRGPREPPNILLVVLDTVRRDHVSCYGYPLPTTPHLDALAAVADRYEGCWSTAPWTLPSHASLFTGQYAFQHGARSGRTASGHIVDALPLASERLTLAEALDEQGYETAAFVANTAYLRPDLGLHQGFDTYVVDRRKGVAMNELALGWLDERAERLASAPAEEERPFFLFVNYMDAHRPYNTTEFEGERAGALPAPSPERSQELLDQLYEEVFSQEDPPPAELVAKVVAQYDMGIANADVALGRLIAELRARGLYDATLIVVTSDHGEYLGEHDLVEHSKDVYEEALRVPLVVKRAGQERGRVIEDRVSLAHMPSLVLAELPREMSRRLAGAFPAPPGEDAWIAENEYSRSKDLGAPYGNRFARERVVLYQDEFKLILSSDGENELYDLEADPREQVNLFATKPELAERLERRLHKILDETPRHTGPQTAPEMTPEQEEELRKLGYTDVETPSGPQEVPVPPSAPVESGSAADPADPATEDR